MAQASLTARGVLSHARVESPPAARLATPFALLGVFGGLALSIAMASLSDGVHHDDDLTHLQIARWSSTWPQNLLHDWGRPGFTVLYALPAQFGWLAARVFSGLLTAATAWLAYCIAVRQGVPLAPLAPWLVWLQPMTFTLSYTTLTETPLAFYLALGMWLFLRQAHVTSAAVMSLCMLTRHEAAVWLPLWALALLIARARWWSVLVLAWAPLAHNVLSAIFLKKWPLLMFLAAKPTEEYGHGDWLAMAARWVLAAGAGPLVLALAGAPRAARLPWGWLWIGAGAVYFLAHTVIFRFGLFASGGYERFLTPIAPVVAVAAAVCVSQFWPPLSRILRRAEQPRDVSDVRLRIFGLLLAGAVVWYACESQMPPWLGWARFWLRVGGGALFSVGLLALLLVGTRNRRVRWLATALCPGVLLWFAGHQCQIAAGVQPPHQQCSPLVLVEDQHLIREATDWLRENGLDRRRIVHNNPWIDEFLGLTGSPFRRQVPFQLTEMRPGDLFVWDRRYVGRPGQIPAWWPMLMPNMVELWHGRSHSRDGIYCRVFERRAAAPPFVLRGR